MQYTKQKRDLKNGVRRGATSLEFALIAPAFLLVVFCCVEFSRMSLLRNMTQNAAYEACRNVIVEGGNVQDAVVEAERVLARMGAREATINVNDGQPITFETQTVTVRIEVPMEANSLLLPYLFFGDRTLVSEMSLNTERYQGFFDGGVAQTN